MPRKCHTFIKFMISEKSKIIRDLYNNITPVSRQSHKPVFRVAWKEPSGGPVVHSRHSRFCQWSFTWTGIDWKETGNRSEAKSKRSGESSLMTTLRSSTAIANSSKARFRSGTASPRIKCTKTLTPGSAVRSCKNRYQGRRPARGQVLRRPARITASP